MTDDAIRVLIIDDEPQIRRLVRNAVLTEPATAMHVLEASSGHEGIDVAAAESPALVILDLGLPDMDGLEVCRELRAWLAAPILVLSARQTDVEKAALLDAGADDFVTKPFSTIELMARLRAQLRRGRRGTAGLADSALQRFGELSVDLQRRRVELAGVPVHLTRTEWMLLRTLVAHHGQTLTHTQLFRDVWGSASGDAQQYLRVYVGHLRRKLERDPVRPRYIHTESGVGYRFEPDGRDD